MFAGQQVQILNRELDPSKKSQYISLSTFSCSRCTATVWPTDPHPPADRQEAAAGPTRRHETRVCKQIRATRARGSVHARVRALTHTHLEEYEEASHASLSVKDKTESTESRFVHRAENGTYEPRCCATQHVDKQRFSRDLRGEPAENLKV